MAATQRTQDVASLLAERKGRRERKRARVDERGSEGARASACAYIKSFVGCF